MLLSKLRDGAKLKGADHSVLGRARHLEALGFLSGEVSLASKPEELLIALAHRCRKLINYCTVQYGVVFDLIWTSWDTNQRESSH